MKSERFVITDNVWEKIWRHLPGKATDRGADGLQNRTDSAEIKYFPRLAFVMRTRVTLWANTPPVIPGPRRGHWLWPPVFLHPLW